MSDKKQQVLDLHNELRQTVAKSRFSHLTSLGELQEFGGKDLYATSVSYIVESSGTNGVLVTRLRDVLPDSIDLNEAIKALKDDGEIEEVGKGRSVRLVSKKKPAVPTESQPAPDEPVDGETTQAPLAQVNSERAAAVAK